MPLLSSLLWISVGAVLGACLRWSLGLLLNPWFSVFSFGTLIANYLGSFIIVCCFLVFPLAFFGMEALFSDRISWQLNHLFSIFDGSGGEHLE